MNIADLFFGARLEDGKLQIDAKKSGDKAGQTLGSSMAASIKKSFSGGELGKGLVQGLGFAGALGGAQLLSTGLGVLTDVISDSIDAASNLNETVSKGKVIFGENSDAVENWADTASKSFGQSKRAALDVASTFAGLFSTVGLALDDATDKAKALTELGSDLASFFNTDVATATQALRSGLAGESEPLRQFNVFLSDAAVQAKATALGMKKVNGVLTEGQKVTARYAIIMDQTTAAQGDFARTADGLANSTRTMEAAWEDASAKLGQALLPIVTEFVQFVANEGIPAMLDFVDAIGEVVKALDELTQVDPNNPLDTLADDISNFPYKAGQEVRHFFEDLIQDTSDWANATESASRKEQEALRAITDGAIAAGLAYSKSAEGMAEDARETAKVLGASASKFGSAINDGLDQSAEDADASRIGAAIGTSLTLSMRRAQPLIKAEGNRLGASIAQGIREKRDAVDQSWQALLDAIHNGMKPAAERAKLVGQLVSTDLIWGLKSKDPAVRAQARATKQAILDRLGELGGAASGIGKTGMDKLKEGMKSKDPEIRRVAYRLYKAALHGTTGNNGPADVGDKAESWGKGIGQGLVNGMNIMAFQVGSAAGNLAKTIADYLATGSPSKLGPLSIPGGPETWGKLVGAGFSKGLGQTLPNLSGALGGALRMPSMSLGSAVPSMAMSGYGGASVSTSHVGGVTNIYNNTANVTGLVKATDPLSIARQLGRSARSGEFRPVTRD